MSILSDELPAKVELAFEPGVWTDVSGDGRLLSQAVEIKRGRGDEASMPASSCSVTLDNPDGHLTPHHPASPYFPNVRRGIPMRFSVFWDGEWHERFVGQVGEIVPSWPHGDLSGPHSPGESYVEITAAGVLRRLSQSDTPVWGALESTLRRGGARRIWPLTDTGSIVYDVIQRDPMHRRGAEIGEDDTLAGSGAPVVSVSSSATATWNNQAMAVPSTPAGEWWVGYLVRLPADLEPGAPHPIGPASLTLRSPDGGYTVSWLVDVSGGNPRWQLQDQTLGAFSGPHWWLTFAEGWHAVELHGFDDGGAPKVEATITPLDGGDPITGSGTPSGATVVGGVRVSEVFMAAPESGVVSSGWVAVADAPVDDFVAAARGWAGEPAAVRMLRIAEDEGVALDVEGDPDETEMLDVQPTSGLVDALTIAASSDWGILDESHDDFGFRYRTRAERERRGPVLILDATANGITPPLAPLEDDQRYHNTVAATNGTVTVEVSDPVEVEALGTYATSLDRNVHQARLDAHAWWGLYLGTWPQMRYPSITVDLSIRTDLIDDWLALRTGDVVRLTGLPSQHPPGHVDLVVEGWSESVESHSWMATLNCSPAGPWRVALVADPDAEPEIIGAKIAPDTCVIRRDEPEVGPWIWDGEPWIWDGEPWIWEDTNAIHVRTGGLPWTEDPTETPWDIYIDGERMTVTKVEPDPTGDDEYDQVLHVTRGVNGIIRPSFASGTAVTLADPAIVAL